MSGPTPNRDGWKDGELAALPAIPPFPEFTDFERLALYSSAKECGPEEGAFREQVLNCRVIDRINTVVGFYTRVMVDRSVCPPVAIDFKGANFEVEHVEYGVGVILWGKDGYLGEIEGFTFGHNGLCGQSLATLRLLGRSP